MDESRRIEINFNDLHLFTECICEVYVFKPLLCEPFKISMSIKEGFSHLVHFIHLIDDEYLGSSDKINIVY